MWRCVFLVSLGAGRRHTGVWSGWDVLDGVVFENGDCERDGRFAAHFERSAGACDAGLVFGAKIESGLVLVVSRWAEVTLRNWVIIGDRTGHGKCV
jgi:hypothetical protein